MAEVVRLRLKTEMALELNGATRRFFTGTELNIGAAYGEVPEETAKQLVSLGQAEYTKE